MKWTTNKPKNEAASEGWYWRRDNKDDEAVEIIPLTFRDGQLVIGQMVIENNNPIPPRPVYAEFSAYPDEEWSDEKIAEPTD